jgi:hypothetical protein
MGKGGRRMRAMLPGKKVISLAGGTSGGTSEVHIESDLVLERLAEDNRDATLQMTREYAVSQRIPLSYAFATPMAGSLPTPAQNGCLQQYAPSQLRNSLRECRISPVKWSDIP